MGQQEGVEREREFDYLLSTCMAHRSILAAAGKPSARGNLLLLCEEALNSLERATAGRIAGAATLFVCAQEQQAKASVRSGACDFLVTGLDEALRILKNEIRRRAAVGVCLHAEPSSVLRACVELGVQPDLLDSAEAALVERGSVPVDWAEALMDGESAVLVELAKGPIALMSQFDSIAAAALGGQDETRQQWMGHAPEVLGRAWQRFRLLPVRGHELPGLIAGIQLLAAQAALQVELREHAFGNASVAMRLF